MCVRLCSLDIFDLSLLSFSLSVLCCVSFLEQAYEIIMSFHYVYYYDCTGIKAGYNKSGTPQ